MCGQIVTDYDVVDPTVAMGEIKTMYTCSIADNGATWYASDIISRNDWDLVKDNTRAIKMTENQKNVFKKYHESCGYKVDVVEYKNT